MDGAYWGGAGAGNIVRQTGIDGWEMRCAWENLESTLGTYTFTALDANIAKVTGWGKRVAISLNLTSYGSATKSRAPNYIVSDNVTYGGVAGHGGELQSKVGEGYPNYHTVNLWNTAVYNRFKALIDALAAQYNGVVEYIIFDELITQVSAADVDSMLGGLSAVAAKQLEIYDYMVSKFTNSTVFIKMNYLAGTGDTRGAVLANLESHRVNGKTGAVELAFPSTGNLNYPNFPPNISNDHLDNTHSLLRTFSPAQRRYFHSESGGTPGSTMSDTTSAVQNRQAIRWAAYMSQGCNNPIWRVSINDGIGGGPGASNYGLQWAALSPYLTSRYLR